MRTSNFVRESDGPDYKLPRGPAVSRPAGIFNVREAGTRMSMRLQE